ncbi:MAG: hypothetical protein ABW042_01430 [Phenylobacterium sp.]
MRRLTAGELALAGEVFGAQLDAARVWISAIPLWNRAFVAGPALMIWPRRGWREDFWDAPIAVQAVFVHELTHVWQAQRGVNLLLGKLRAGDGPGAYAYNLATCGGFDSLNIEQQAMVVEHAFRLRRGGKAPFTAEAYAAVLPKGLCA